MAYHTQVEYVAHSALACLFVRRDGKSLALAFINAVVHIPQDHKIFAVVIGPYDLGRVAIANSDGTLNSPSNPAKVGGFITIYGTGGGVTNPLGITGGLWPITASLATLTLAVSVSIGGTNAIVLYAGSAPTLESGYFLINVALPSGLQASSAVNLVLTVGGSSSVAVPISIQ